MLRSLFVYDAEDSLTPTIGFGPRFHASLRITCLDMASPYIYLLRSPACPSPGLLSGLGDDRLLIVGSPEHEASFANHNKHMPHIHTYYILLVQLGWLS